MGGREEEQRRERLRASDALLDQVEMPRSLADAGIARADFEVARPDLTRAAFMDPSVRTNPRTPLISELVALLEAGYEGREPG